MTRRDFSTWEVQASFKVNSVLARALHKAISFGSYDRFQAHTWALRVINANPQSAEDMSAALVNFDHMIEAARANYQTKALRRKQCDEAFAAYAKWQADQEREAA